MDAEYLKEMGERIKKQRILRHMTQVELGYAVGYNDKSSIAKIEAGTRDISHDKIIKFAKALGVTESYIMGWDTSPWADTPVQNKAVDMLHEYENKQLREMAEKAARNINPDLTKDENKIMNLFRMLTPENQKELIRKAAEMFAEQ